MAPWAGLLALNALFVLPAVARQLSRQPLLLLTPSGDLLLLVALCTAAVGWRRGTWVIRSALLLLLLLWFYLWPAMIGQIIIRQAPLLYDLVFLLKHVGVLVMDLWTWPRFGALLGGITGLGLLLWLGKRIFVAVVRELATRPPLRTAGVGAAMVASLLALSLAHDHRRVVGTRFTGPVAWTAPALADNLGESLRMYQRIQRGLEHSPYAEYRERYQLTRKPDVHLLLVESYGRILFSHPDTVDRWHGRMAHYQQRLDAAGWHVVSTFSEAPVSGGGSWLAEATLLTGIRVRYEAVFRHLVDDIRRTPNLVNFLDAQGYHTVLVAPKDRARPGIQLENRYDYDTTVFALDLEYEGPPIGWGIIPDQYSVGYAHDNVLSGIDEPVFTNFHLVSSHAPWTVVPRVVDDWRTLGEPEDGAEADARQGRGSGNLRELGDRLRHYKRFAAPRYAYMGEASGYELSSFADTIDYDLEVIVRHLERLPDDALVIVMGDHQPPLVSEADDTYDVPVHVLARDPELLRAFVEAGFTEGMDINGGRFTTLMHEAVFSLMVRALVQCCTAPGTEAPRMRPNGIRIGN